MKHLCSLISTWDTMIILMIIMIPSFTSQKNLAGMGKLMGCFQVKKLIPEVIGKEIEKQCKGIFPLKDCMIRKVKIMKKPKFDITKPLGEIDEVISGKLLHNYMGKIHHFQWLNPLFLWPCSIANCRITRGYITKCRGGN